MKKVMMMLVMAMSMMLVTGCDGGNTPSGVAEKSMKLLKDKDYKGYVDLFYFSEKAKKEEIEKNKQLCVSLMESKATEEFEKKGGIKEYKVVSEEVKDSVATVKVNVVYGNNSTKDENIKLKKDTSGNWKIDVGK